MGDFVQRWLPLPGRLRRRLADYLRASPFLNDTP